MINDKKMKNRLIYFLIIGLSMLIISSCEKNNPTESISEPAVGGYLRYGVYVPDIKSANSIDVFVNNKKVSGDSLFFERTFPSVEYTVLQEGENNVQFRYRASKAVLKDTTVNVQKDVRRALFLVGRLADNSVSTFMLDEYTDLPALPNDSTSFIRLVNINPGTTKYDLVRELNGVVTPIVQNIGFKGTSAYVPIIINQSLGEVYYMNSVTKAKIKPTTAYIWFGKRYYTMYIRPGATTTSLVLLQSFIVDVFNQ